MTPKQETGNKAEEMAAKYREMLLAKASGQPLSSMELPGASAPVADVVEEEIPAASEEVVEG